MNAVAHAQYTFDILTLLLKYLYHQSQYLKTLDSKSLALITQIRHEFEGSGFESPSGRDIFCLKNFDTFTRTPVRVPKMNDVDCAQLILKMLDLL